MGSTRRVLAQRGGDLRPRGERALIVRVDVVDIHADVLALDAAPHRADRAVGALRADADHAAAELDQRMADHALRAHAPRARVFTEPELAQQVMARGADIM